MVLEGVEGEDGEPKVPPGLPSYAIWTHLNLPKFTRFVKSMTFETTMAVAIAYNCITIGVSVHMCPPETSLRSREGCPQVFLDLSEHLCTFAFLLEWLMRGVVQGFSKHFTSVKSCSDTFLVWVAGVLLTWFLEPLFGTGGEMRLLTVLRAFRLLRVVRVARFKLKEMWLLLKGLAMSFKTLLSAIAVFVFINYLFGILAVTIIGDSSAFHDSDETLREVHSYFWGLDESMFTLLQIVTGDSWASGIARPLLSIMPSLWFFFVGYFAVAGLVLMNLITAIIVDNAIQMSKDDEEQRLHELQQESKAQFKKLESIFKAIDEDGSGEVDKAEFERKCLGSADILQQFRLLGFEQLDLDEMFDDLAGSDGVLSLDEFLLGLRAMLGIAKAVDIVRIENNVHRMSKRLDELVEILQQEGRIQKDVHVSKSDAINTDSNKECVVNLVASEDSGITEGHAEGKTGHQHQCWPGASSAPQDKAQKEGVGKTVKSSSIASSAFPLPPNNVSMATGPGVEHDRQAMVRDICENMGILIQEQFAGLQASMAQMVAQQIRDNDVTVRPAYDELPPFQTPAPLNLSSIACHPACHFTERYSPGRRQV